MAATADPASNERDQGALRLTDPRLLSAIWMGAIASKAVLVLPLVIGGLASRLDLSATAAGFAASASLLGACLMSLLQASLLLNAPRRPIAAALIAGQCTGYLVLTIHPSYWIAVACMTVIGAGMGGLLVLAVRTFAESGQQTRATGVQLAVQGLLGTGVAAIVAAIYDGPEDDTKLFLLMVAVAAAAAPAIAGMPNRGTLRPVEPASLPGTRPVFSAALVLALVAWGIMAFANGGFWPLIERIAAADGRSVHTITHAITYSTMGMVGGGALAALLGTRLREASGIALTGAATAIAILVLVSHPSDLLFMVSLTMFGFFWNFGPPYQMPAIARADPSGRGMALSITAMKMCMAIGPVAYGFAADRLGYSISGYLAASVALLATALFLLSLRLARVPHGQASLVPA